MDTGVYIKRSNEGIVLLPGAEVIDDWEGGCLIRSDEKLELSAGFEYYIVEEDQLIAVKVPPTEVKTAPFDYPVDKDRSHTRALALVGTGGA